MASSGQTTFDLSIDDVIEQAFEQVGGQPISGEEARSARICLNLLMTEWQNRGVLLWKLADTPVTVSTSVTEYTLDSDIIDSLQTTITVNGNDLEMNRITYQDYMKLPDKSQTGRPTQFSFLRGKDNVSMVVWPTPEQTYTMNLLAMTRVQDVTASAVQTSDLPFRFLPRLLTDWRTNYLPVVPALMQEGSAFSSSSTRNRLLLLLKKIVSVRQCLSVPVLDLSDGYRSAVKRYMRQVWVAV